MGKRSSTFPTRINCRSAMVGLGAVALGLMLVGLYWSHISTEAAITSALMAKINKLEESLLEHHQHEHGELKRGSQERAEDLERIKGDLTDVQSSVKAVEEEKKALAIEKDRRIEELNRKVNELETGLSAHERHHKVHIEPNMHTHRPLAIGDSSHHKSSETINKNSGRLRGAVVSSSSLATATAISGESSLGAGSLGRIASY